MTADEADAGRLLGCLAWLLDELCAGNRSAQAQLALWAERARLRARRAMAAQNIAEKAAVAEQVQR